MSKTYKIKLTPLDWYFFGGETTFGEGSSNNYLAKSNLLPQETALLGMLRFELLKSNGLIPINSDERRVKADALIGKSSFNFTIEKNKIAEFGSIKSISPVFLSHGVDILIKTPKNHNQDIRFESDFNSIVYTNQSSNAKLPAIEGFSCKKIPKESWLSINGKQEHFETNEEKPEEGIFRTKIRIGITKASVDRQDDNKDGFFKTELCTLNKGYSFLFYATLDSDVLKGNRLISLGAERSMFNMEVEEVPSCLDELLKCVKIKEGELFFVSDAFVDSKILSLCKFSWTDTTPFRNLIRINQAKKNYASLNRKEEKSDRFNLIRRGSILFFSPEMKDKITTLINDNYLQSFGYNKYLIKE